MICNHVLEHVENDSQAFREIMRILRSGGFLQFSVPNPKVRTETVDWGYPRADLHDHYRNYGRDLMQRFGEAQPGVEILEVEATDDVTGVAYPAYFASLDGRVLDAMEAWFKRFNPIRCLALRFDDGGVARHSPDFDCFPRIGGVRVPMNMGTSLCALTPGVARLKAAAR